VVHKLGDGFELETIGARAPDKAKSLDMFEIERRIAAPATSAAWRLQQAAFPVEPHFLNTYTRSPSQLGESERPRSHLHISEQELAARTGQARYS
jgi:hypothetical protein